VELVVETHDAWVDSGMLIEAFKVAGFPKGASILWDVHHPYRMNGEDPDLTWKNIGSLVKYTHWKDSYLEEVAKEGGGTESRTQLCLMGKGDIPLRRIMEILVDAGYDGWYTLEWERKWHPEIDAPEVAFPQYIKYMKDLLSKILK
jgi:sugar phosphate isomerase/epimerase